MAAETIGFIGTGRMGGPMAGRLIDAGYSLCVYDTQTEATEPLVTRGARLAKSPAEVASSADIVLASLPTPDIVKAVTLGPGRHHRRQPRHDPDRPLRPPVPARRS